MHTQGENSVPDTHLQLPDPHAPCPPLPSPLARTAEVALGFWSVKAEAHPLMVMVAPADKALSVCPPGKTAGAMGAQATGDAAP